MASIEQTVTVKLVCAPPEMEVMDEAQFKKYLLRLLREAINEKDAVVIQPDSHQAMILRGD